MLHTFCNFYFDIFSNLQNSCKTSKRTIYPLSRITIVNFLSQILYHLHFVSLFSFLFLNHFRVSCRYQAPFFLKVAIFPKDKGIFFFNTSTG